MPPRIACLPSVPARTVGTGNQDLHRHFRLAPLAQIHPAERALVQGEQEALLLHLSSALACLTLAPAAQPPRTDNPLTLPICLTSWISSHCTSNSRTAAGSRAARPAGLAGVRGLADERPGMVARRVEMRDSRGSLSRECRLHRGCNGSWLWVQHLSVTQDWASEVFRLCRPCPLGNQLDCAGLTLGQAGSHPPGGVGSWATEHVHCVCTLPCREVALRRWPLLATLCLHIQ